MLVTARETSLELASAALASKGRSFYWASHLLSPLHASRATRLYGFCRWVDDLADLDRDCTAARAKLAQIAHDIRVCSSDKPVVADMIALIGECAIDPYNVLELIAGVSSDLEPVCIENIDELLAYCFRVAGTVGLMMCSVLDVRDVRARSYAVNLGIAMQLTNICRDVAEDAQSGRCYLPASMLNEVVVEDLAQPQQPTEGQIKKAISTLLDVADHYYSNGELGLPYLPLRARAGILVAARIYRAIGTQIKIKGCSYSLGRIVVSPRQKMAITVKALIEAAMSPKFWRARRYEPTLPDSVQHITATSKMGGAKS